MKENAYIVVVGSTLLVKHEVIVECRAHPVATIRSRLDVPLQIGLINTFPHSDCVAIMCLRVGHMQIGATNRTLNVDWATTDEIFPLVNHFVAFSTEMRAK